VLVIEQNIPIIKQPDKTSERPVVVSIPHYGTEPIPGINFSDYSDPDFIHMPWGYADTFSAEVYGNADAFGAFVVATPYSRLFVDVNRRRNDFSCENGVVTSTRGVFRTHTRRGKPIFTRDLTQLRAEQILTKYYDPFHDGLQSTLTKVRESHGHVLLFDMHTASPNRIGNHSIVVGTRGSKTADRATIDHVIEIIASTGIDVHEDIPGYSGGHIVRHYGEDGENEVQAIQIEINAGLLMTTARDELVRRLTLGERPDIDLDRVQQMICCLEALVRDVCN